MDRPTLHTDAYEDETARRVPIIFLAGPIKHWWTCWGSVQHRKYIRHRKLVRADLIDAGYLTYAAWDAIKGTWDDRAQAINDAAIRVSDLVLVLTPEGIPAVGTTAEVEFARGIDVPVRRVRPGVTLGDLLQLVTTYVGEGAKYE